MKNDIKKTVVNSIKMVRLLEYEKVLCTECIYYLRTLGAHGGSMPLLYYPEVLDDPTKYNIQCESCIPKMKMAMKQFAKAVQERGAEGECGVKWLDIEVEGEHDCMEVIAYEKEMGTRRERVVYDVPVVNEKLPYDQEWVLDKDGEKKQRCTIREIYSKWRCNGVAAYGKRCHAHTYTVRGGPRTVAGDKWLAHRGGCMAEARKKGVDVDEICCPEEDYYKIMFEHENGVIKYHKSGCHSIPVYRPCEECGHVAVLDKNANPQDKSHHLHRVKASQTYKWNLENSGLMCVCAWCNSKNSGQDKLDHKESGTQSMKWAAIKKRNEIEENPKLREALEASFAREMILEDMLTEYSGKVKALEKQLKEKETIIKEYDEMFMLWDKQFQRRSKKVVDDQNVFDEGITNEHVSIPTEYPTCNNVIQEIVQEDLSNIDISNIEQSHEESLEDNKSETAGDIDLSKENQNKTDENKVLTEDGLLVDRCSKAKRGKNDYVWRCPKPVKPGCKQCKDCLDKSKKRKTPIVEVDTPEALPVVPTVEADEAAGAKRTRTRTRTRRKGCYPIEVEFVPDENNVLRPRCHKQSKKDNWRCNNPANHGYKYCQKCSPRAVVFPYPSE